MVAECLLLWGPAPPAPAAAAAAAARLLLDDELTVDSWSWINIMWSPSLMVRLRGARPDKKSATCNENIKISLTSNWFILVLKYCNFYNFVLQNNQFSEIDQALIGPRGNYILSH